MFYAKYTIKTDKKDKYLSKSQYTGKFILTNFAWKEPIPFKTKKLAEEVIKIVCNSPVKKQKYLEKSSNFIITERKK